MDNTIDPGQTDLVQFLPVHLAFRDILPIDTGAKTIYNIVETRKEGSAS